MQGRNDWVLVTGATGGIGSALVRRLAAGGCNVIAAARQPDHVVKEGRIVGLQLDLERPETIADAARAVTDRVGNGGLAALVNMAGIIVEGPLVTTPPAVMRRQFDINVISLFALTQALLPLLKKARGKVVNIGAISAHITVPFYGPTAASKAALAALNDAMRMEFAPFGIDVVLIEPGAMKTGIFATSRALRDKCLASAPDEERRYRRALDAMDRAFEKAGADDPNVVVDAIIKMLARRHAKPRQVIGKGTGTLLMLARLPIRTRDRLVKNALGLGEALKPMR